jgi:hypothetical protein
MIIFIVFVVFIFTNLCSFDNYLFEETYEEL